MQMSSQKAIEGCFSFSVIVSFPCAVRGVSSPADESEEVNKQTVPCHQQDFQAEKEYLIFWAT
jgi:hypothetical protein